MEGDDNAKNVNISRPTPEETALTRLKADKAEAETKLTRRRTEWEEADNIRKSISATYPFGKDCSMGNICHPYTMSIEEVLWGYSAAESGSTHKYAECSSLATLNIKNALFKYHHVYVPTIPNLVAGLPAPFRFRANVSCLSADEKKPYWLWPHSKDPNPGVIKHGRVVYNCINLKNDLIATKSIDFAENELVYMTCNDVPSIFKS